MLDFNTEPYNDDFDENNKFYRILFRPSFAVQARELTQLQTILQNQIKRNGDAIFKQGAMVIPGQISIDTNYNYVKLQEFFGGSVTETYVDNLVGQTLVGQTSGVSAVVLHVEHAIGEDPTTLYVRYLDSGDDNETKTFANDEELTDSVNTPVQTLATSATGKGSAAVIQRGVYYVNGFFVLCDGQTIVLDKYTNLPSYRVGLKITETKVTPEENETLLDNAQNSYNYAAPGAHRYFIDLTLTAIGIDSTSDENFIELLTTKEGTTQKIVNKTAYSEIEKTFARRTYDESGNYTVKQFKIDVREHRSNDRGQWLPSTAYLIGDVVTNGGYTYVAKASGTSVNIAPVHTSGDAYDGSSSTGVQWTFNSLPYYNRGIFTPAQGGDESKLAVGLEPGKAYVDGYEIEKIVTEYVDVDKARDFVQVSDAFVQSPVGNYVLVTNLNSLPPFDSTTGFGKVTIYNRFTTSAGSAPAGATAIGTARIKSITWSSGSVGASTAVYKLYLFDLNLTSGYSFAKDAKSFFFSKTGPDFTADISSVNTTLVGSATTYTTYPTKGASTTLTGIGSAWFGGTTTSPAVKVGDYIYVGDISIANRRRITAVTSNNSIVVDSSVSADGSIITLIRTNVLEPENSSLVYKLPNYAIKGVRNSLNAKKIIYYATQYLAGTTGSVTGTAGTPGAYCTLTINTPSGVFASEEDTDNYIVALDDTSGTIINPLSISAGGSTSITFTIDCSVIDYGSKAFVVMSTIKKIGSDGGEKTKTLTTGTVTFTSQAAATQGILKLAHADIFRINSVLMKSGTWGSEGSTYEIDIIDRFEFDNGQKDTHYDIGSLVLKHSFAPPSASIQVTFDYFEHSTGDYFTVNSYPATVKYGDIPQFNGTSLRDVIDFRPRIGNAGTVFSGSGSSYSLIPKRGTDITVDYTYYLSRKDKIAIDFSGRFFDLRGIPSNTPAVPQDPALGMVLYTLSIEPFTFGTSNSSVVIETHENKRYTMRDIGKLENRINNLEYYTSLSLVEQDTKQLAIKDSTGLDRFKNGFIIDSFTGHNVGNVLSPDYLCAVDMQNNELRPFYTMNNVNLVETLTTDTDRDNIGNYKLYGDVITLPVVAEPVMVRQQYGSRLENINPFAVFTFLGDVRMNPSSDDWFETAQRPDIIRNVEGSFNTIAALAMEANILGTVWNAWQVTWAPPVTPPGGRLIQYTSGDNWANQRALEEGATYIDVNTFNARFGNQTRTAPARQVYVETQAQTATRYRTGVKSTLAVQYEQQVIDDKVVSTAIIPYIRSRNILIQTKKLKPNTRFYPYFDNIAVAEYCTPASFMTYTLTGSTDFDTTSNAGGLSNDPPRVIDTVSGKLNADTSGNMCLNVGDVITGGTSGATAVVIGKDYNQTTLVRTLHVANIKGTFISSETITGSISGAIGTCGTTHEANKAQGDALVTNYQGDINFIFWLPQNSSVKFRTGTREFKLLDVSTVSGQQTSSAKIQYEATGTLETRQRTVNSIRNAHIIQEIVNENDTISRTLERVVRDTGWYDPLAQTFLVQQKGGAFLSKVDVFFATKDTNLPVTLEIREVVNGYPGQKILPFSKVTLYPQNVNISNNLVQMTDGSGANYPKYDAPTTFTFPSPVYVQENQEYALVLASDSNNYKVWISQMGDQIPGSSRTISEQPYLGSLFKSQNATTWTAAQDQDLMFTIYRCQFDTQVTGSVQFANDVISSNVIDSDPFEVVEGATKLRVWHRDHGLFVGSKVAFDNVDPTVYTGLTGSGTITTSSSSTEVNGVGTAFINEIPSAGTVLFRASDGKYLGVIDHVTDDSTLVLRANCTTTIGSAVAFKYADSLNGIPVTEIYKKSNPIADLILTVSDVDLDSYVISTTTAGDVTGYTGGMTVTAPSNVMFDILQPHIQMQNFSDTTCEFLVKTTAGKSVDGSESPHGQSDFIPVVPNDSNYFYAPQVVLSPVNQDAFVSAKTLTIEANLTTTNDALSPIIDTHRVSAITISNKINNPREDNINVAEIDNRTLFTGTTGAFSFANIGSPWSPLTAYAEGSQIYYNNNLYTVSKTGVTPPTPPTHTSGVVSYYPTATTLSSVIITGSAGQFSCSATALYVGQPITITGSYGGTGSISGYSSGTTYYIIATNGSTTFTLSAINGGGAITTTAGTPTGLTYTTTSGTIELTYAGGCAKLTTTNSSVAALMQTISVGKYITISSATTTGNNGTYLVTGVDTDGSTYGTIVISGKTFVAEDAASGTTVELRVLFVDEIAPVGSSSINKYVSKAITLANPSNYLNIRFSTNCPTEADVLVYYKTSAVGSTKDFQNVNWSLATPKGSIVKVKNGDGTFNDVQYDVDGLASFDTVMVKLVMQSTNSSAIPRIKDLRIIACA